jgi:ataxia telangiectasia mutated family protein
MSLIKTSSAGDLAVVVFVVSRTLELAGCPGGDDHTQIWSLRCLIQLAESTACVASVSPTPLIQLDLAWQDVWNILHRPTLRYIAFSKDTTLCSRGELIFVLLERIVRLGCTDLGCVKAGKRRLFLCDEIYAVWNLPAFSDAIKVASPHVFALVRSTLCFCGLGDEKPTGIDERMADSLSTEFALQLRSDVGEALQRSKRFKLLCFCLRRFAYEVSGEARNSNIDLVSLLATCCVSIVTGKDPETLFHADCLKYMRRHSLEYSVVDMTSKVLELDSSAAQAPWSDVARNSMVFFDIVQGVRCHSGEVVSAWSSTVGIVHVDFVSQRHIVLMQKFSIDYLSALFAGESGRMISQPDGVAVEQAPFSAGIVRKAFVIRMWMVVACHDQSNAPDLKVIKSLSAEAATFIEEFARFLQSSTTEIEDTVQHMESLVLEALFLCDMPIALQHLKQSMTELKRVCVGLLETYNFSRSHVETKAATAVETKIMGDHLWESDDEEDVTSLTNSKKRRLSVSPEPDKRQKMSLPTSMALQSLKAASSVAAILILLEPSVATCDFIFTQLSVLKSSRDRESCVEVDGALAALDVICSKLNIISDDGENDATFVGKCLRFVHEIRYGTHGGDVHFGVGFKHLAVLLKTRSHGAFTSDNLQLLTSAFLMPESKEQRWIRMRPVLKVHRLTAAIEAFEHGCGSFREAFANIFARNLMTESLDSESILLRLVSARAVGLELRLQHNQDDVFKSVIRTLVVDEIQSTETSLLLSLSGAQASRNDSSPSKNSVEPVRYSLLQLWGTMAGCTTDRSLFRSCLFDCLHLASSDPALELVCQGAIEKMACLKGYQSIDQLVSDEGAYLWGKVVDTRIPPDSIPLNFVSNTFLARVKCMGLKSTRVWDILESEGDSIRNLALQATAEFLIVSVPTALPVCLSNLSLAELAWFAQPNAPSIRSEIIEYANSLISFSDGDEESNRSNRGFLQRHVASLLAHGMLETARGGNAKKPHRLLRLGLELVSDEVDDQQKASILFAAIRQMLKSQGSELYEGLDSDAYSALTNLDVMTPHDWPAAEDVIRAGAIELLMDCRFWLDRAQVQRYKTSRWRTLAMLIKVVLQDQHGIATNCEVAIRIILGILHSVSLRCCHVFAVDLISDHLEDVVDRSLMGKTSDPIFIYQLVATLLQVHERCQRAILDSLQKYCHGVCPQERHSSSTTREERKTAKGDNSVGCALGSWILDNSDLCTRICSEDDKVLAIATYDLLEKLLTLWISSKAHRQDDASADILSFFTSDDAYDVLVHVDKKFAARTLFRNFQSVPSPDPSPRRHLFTAISRFAFFKERLSFLDGSGYHIDDLGSLGINSRLLLDQTVALKASLRQLGRIDACTEMYRISRGLLEIVADNAIALELRVEASKCIGHVGSGAFGELLDVECSADPPSDWLKLIVADRASLMTFMTSKVLEILVDHMKTEPPLSALAALEACREIASTQEGVDAINCISAGNCKAFMKTLRPSLLKKKPSMLTPSDVFVDNAIRLSNTTNEMNQDSSEWCWSERLWEPGHGTYEDWIKRLVSSIIICCYRIKRAPHEVCIRGRTLSFRAFARVSALSSSIATYLFPRVILDLLLSDTVAAKNEPQNFKTVEQSWIGNPQSLAAQQVSHAVGSLVGCLEKWPDAEFSCKAHTLLAFTFDLLRRISQKRFLDCDQFQPGLSKVPVSKNRNKAPRRFGSVLNLKPKTSTLMFVASSKVASAIYYAETALSETGFGLSTSMFFNSPYSRMHASLMPSLRECALTLQEPEAASAYALILASIEFLGSDVGFSEHFYHSASAESPGLLHGRKNAEDETILGIANTVEGLGSIEALRAYVDSVFREQHVSETAKKSLRETWFEAKLTTMNWTNIPDIIAFDGIAIKGTQQGFFEALSGALVSLSNEDTNSFEEHLTRCRVQALSQCSSNYGLESPLSSASAHVEYFEILNDLELIASNRTSLPSLLARWDRELSGSDNYCRRPTSLTLNKLTLAFRETIVSILQTLNTPNLDLEGYLTKIQWQSLSISREQGNLEFADGCLKRLERRIFSSESNCHVQCMKLRLEEAKLMECRGYLKPAVQATKLIVQSVDLELRNPKTSHVVELAELKADSLLYCGIWTRKHKVESAKFVQENYLMPAASVCHDLWTQRESPENRRRLSSSCLALAENAAILFESVHNRITSKEWKAKNAFLEEQRKIVRQLEDPKRLPVGSIESPKEMNRLRQAKKLVGRLEEEKHMLEEELGPYACLALQSFGESLSNCDKSSNEHWTSHVFRMISIWFSTHLLEPDVNVVIDSVFQMIPTFRFLPLTYQLLSRISAGRGLEWDAFQTALSKLIVLMCEQHPYHCLPQLLTLIHGDDHRSVDESCFPKIQAANAIMATLREAADANQLDLYNTYEAITEAYHSLAMATPTERHKKQRRGIPIKDFLKRNDFRAILLSAKCVPCILTRPPTVIENHDYGNFKIDPPGTELMKEIQPECCLAPSGLTRPKILVCVGSKGTLFKQLVKGNDDIRQDAIMQQVFTYANELLRRRTVHSRANYSHRKKGDTRCLSKTLKLLTYNVVPLSPKSGILEWVDNTQPFLDYLQDRGTRKRGAHSRYWEGEWSFQLCMEEMMKVSSAKHEEKRAVFDRICENFSPVFRYFFVEMFGHDLQAWHTAKMAYTRTCAVSSIVGHMLGIGDRHANNILVHQKTGELVHIDFGIVFEQGHLLPTPETVPFRLTRDIVDGMGPLGTEGTFIAAAEETTQILRENADTLLTILSGVVSDPQYEWRKGASKARARQEKEDETADLEVSKFPRIEVSHVVDDPTDNLATKHTIARIKEKLQGYEEGTSSEQQSVEGQVQLLINCARDPDNLCAIWRGWAPWL